MKKFWIILLSIIAAIVIAYFCLPQYARKALIYLTPNIDDLRLFPTNTIKAEAPEDVVFHPDYNKTPLSNEYRKEIEELDPVAFAVFQNGELLYEEYWDNYNDSTISNLFSASKSIISLLIGIAIDHGFIFSIHDTANQYILEWGDEYDFITIEDLLTMSSGLDWDEGYNSLFNKTTEAYYGKDLKKLILEQKPNIRPGTEYYYSSATTALLGLVLKNATGMTISDFASKYLWAPIGAQHDAEWSLDHEGGMEKSYCCFYSNARDLGRIGQLILQDGQWNGQKVVSKEYLNGAFTPASKLIDENNYRVNYYGYQWWLLKYKFYNIKYARGIYGQYIITIPELNMVVVRLGNKRSDIKVGEHPKDVFLYIDAATSMIE